MTTDYPQQPYPVAGPPSYYGPPAPQKKKRTLLWVLIGVLAGVLICGGATVVGLGALAGSAVEEIDKQIQYGSDEKRAATKITSCRVGPLGVVEVGYKVTNDTERVQSYLLTFEIKNAAGTRLGEADDAINGLAPGDTATDSAPSTVQNPKKGFTCGLVRAD